MKKYLEKLQALPENKKKIILWVVVVIFGAVMAFFWATGAVNTLSKIGQSIGQINFSKTQAPEAPNTTTPKIAIADWQTYRNENFGFEIKIPLNLIEDFNVGASLGFTTSDLLKGHDDYCKKNGCDSGLDPAVIYFEYLEGKDSSYSQEDISNGISEVKLSGISWTRYQSDGNSVHYRFLDSTKNIAYDFNAGLNDENLLKQVLSTFKFFKK